MTLILKEGAEYTGRGWPVKVPVLPRVTSQGELIGCCGPSAPPSLSVPCTPVPAKVETFPSERLIWRRRRRKKVKFYWEQTQALSWRLFFQAPIRVNLGWRWQQN